MLKTIEVGKFKVTPDADRYYEGRGRQPTQAFCIAFVYPKDEEPCVVKGMRREVETYIAQHFPFCIYTFTTWQKGKSLDYGWRTPAGLQLYFSVKYPPDYSQGNKRPYHTVSFLDNEGKFHGDIFKFRRFPKKWLPIYDKAVYRKTGR